jgi:hypothetical protein
MKDEPKSNIAKKDKANEEENVIKGLVLKEMLKRIEEKVDNNDTNFIRTLKTMINEDKEVKSDEKPKKH